MKITQKDRIKYIKNPKKFIKNKKLNKKSIAEFEDSIKGGNVGNECIVKEPTNS